MFLKKAEETANRWLVAPVWFVYLVLLAAAEHAHTFWRDEAEAWIVARDSHGLLSLLHNVRYEGHPPLWYFVLWVITRFTHDPEWMKVANFVFAAAAALLILRARAAPMWVRCGLVFSYYVLFEYGAIDRNYMLGLAFLLAAVHAMKWTERAFAVPVLLGGAALSCLPALIVAVCLYPLHLLPVLSTEGERRRWGRRLSKLDARRWVAAGVFAACVLLAVAIVKPPKDSGLLLDSLPAGTMAKRVAHPFHDVAKAYVPVLPWRVAFWEGNAIDARSPVVFTLLGVAVLALLCGLFRNRAVRGFFVAATVLLLAQMAVSRRTDMRHVGWLFVVFALALLLREAPWLQEAREGDGFAGWRGVFVGAVLALQVVAGVFAAVVSAGHAFSASKEASEFLRAQGWAEQPMMFVPDFVSLPVLSYLERPNAYYVEQHALGSIVVWNTAEHYGRHVPSRAEYEAAAQGGVMPVLVTENPLDAQELGDLRVREVAEFTGAICGDRYYIYR